MKRLSILLVLALVLGFGVSSAFAAPQWIGSVSDGYGNWTADNITDFDWSSAGSAMAQGLTANIVPGTSFTLLYQAKLVGLLDVNGNIVALPGLASTYEYTLVATIPEMVSGLTFSGTSATALFETLAGGTFYLYYDSNPNAVVATGMGFDDGELVMSGTISAGQTSSFTASAAGTKGTGSFVLDGDVTYLLDGDYLDPDYVDGLQFIIEFEVTGSLNQPVGNSDTTTFFGSRAGEGNYAPVAFNPLTDTLFKSDTSNTLYVIPEPSSVILMGVGLLGLASISRKRMKK